MYSNKRRQALSFVLCCFSQEFWTLESRVKLLTAGMMPGKGKVGHIYLYRKASQQQASMYVKLCCFYLFYINLY